MKASTWPNRSSEDASGGVKDFLKKDLISLIESLFPHEDVVEREIC